MRQAAVSDLFRRLSRRRIAQSEARISPKPLDAVLKQFVINF